MAITEMTTGKLHEYRAAAERQGDGVTARLVDAELARRTGQARAAELLGMSTDWLGL